MSPWLKWGIRRQQEVFSKPELHWEPLPGVGKCAVPPAPSRKLIALLSNQCHCL